jgi:hypothetical protein
MKKILFASTALVAASLASASSASEPLTGSVGGYMMIGLVYQTDQNDELGVLRDGEIFLNFRGTSDNGLTFRGRVELEGFTTGDQIDENWGEVSGSWGAIRIGSDDDAADANERGVFYGPQGRIGYYDSFYSVMFSSNGADVPMIRYSTPSFSGFSAAVDWAPSAGADGAFDSGLVFGDNNRFAAGASWDGEFGGFSIGIGAGFVTWSGGTNPNGPAADFTSWNVGAQVGFSGFSFGVQYDSAGNAGVEDDGAIAIGAQYETGPWTFAGGVSFSTDASAGNTDKVNWGVWATYALAPGVSATLGYEGNDTNVNDTTVTAYLLMAF